MQLHINSLLPAIPRGQVATYGQLAAMVGCPRLSRYVGQILHRNDQPVQYPCYKVVGAAGDLTGYALGIEKKKQLLQADGLVIDEANRLVDWPAAQWRPRLYSYFLAFPVVGEALSLFQQVVKNVTSVDSRCRFQNPQSPHVTLIYFGELNLSQLAAIVTGLRCWERIPRPVGELRLAGLNYFRRRGGVIGHFPVVAGEEDCRQYQSELLSQLSWPPEPRPFRPHLTFFRRREGAGAEDLFTRLSQIISSVSFRLSVDMVRLYCSIDDHRQVPLVDFRPCGSKNIDKQIT